MVDGPLRIKRLSGETAVFRAVHHHKIDIAQTLNHGGRETKLAEHNMMCLPGISNQYTLVISSPRNQWPTNPITKHTGIRSQSTPNEVRSCEV